MRISAFFQDKVDPEKKEVEVEDRKFEPSGNDRDLVDMLGEHKVGDKFKQYYLERSSLSFLLIFLPS